VEGPKDALEQRQVGGKAAVDVRHAVGVDLGELRWEEEGGQWGGDRYSHCLLYGLRVLCTVPTVPTSSSPSNPLLLLLLLLLLQVNLVILLCEGHLGPHLLQELPRQGGQRVLVRLVVAPDQRKPVCQ
jgi:hypothetical protein